MAAFARWQSNMPAPSTATARTIFIHSTQAPIPYSSLLSDLRGLSVVAAALWFVGVVMPDLKRSMACCPHPSRRPTIHKTSGLVALLNRQWILFPQPTTRFSYLVCFYQWRPVHDIGVLVSHIAFDSTPIRVLGDHGRTCAKGTSQNSGCQNYSGGARMNQNTHPTHQTWT